MSENYCPNVNNLEPASDRVHLSRYLLARGFISPGETVADVACGYGYGSYFISEVAKSVVGFDRDGKAIASSKNRYPNLAFNLIDLEKEASSLPIVDTFVSLETIEHLDDPFLFLKTMMNKSSKIILSSPNKDTVGLTPWHKHNTHLNWLIKTMDSFPDWHFYQQFDQGYHYIAILIRNDYQWKKN